MPDFYLNIVLLLLIMNKLTVIIPFLNEGEELENTLRSIREHADGEVDILVINDASTDGWDYGSVARKFRAEYVVNERRMGVAASRDLGVERCRSSLFFAVGMPICVFTIGIGWGRSFRNWKERKGRCFVARRRC